MNLRTPLGKVLGYGTAKEGTEHFIAQRVSAIALLLLGLWFAISIGTLDGLRHDSLIAFVAVPQNTVLLILLCAALAYHSYLGVQVVIEDYVHAEGLKFSLLLVSRFAHILLGIAPVYAVLKIGLAA